MEALSQMSLFVQIQVTHTAVKEQTHRVRGLTKQGADALTFPIAKTGQTITVKDYFEQQYNIRSVASNIPMAATAKKPPSPLGAEYSVHYSKR